MLGNTQTSATQATQAVVLPLLSQPSAWQAPNGPAGVLYPPPTLLSGHSLWMDSQLAASPTMQVVRLGSLAQITSLAPKPTITTDMSMASLVTAASSMSLGSSPSLGST
ncbi:hypothetical protein NUW54_g4493 [Trametes sanguinea]|uniref:Uncharacterized protein n=1 Tax=Trametes sanguinea TaxID=158606 RepID=A0ACC1PZ17_9APHY|nr:hypothetical protein NUW54_g4493 [Trametes sanguinea]